MPKYLCNPNSFSDCVLSIFPNVYQRNHLNYNGLHLKKRRDTTDLLSQVTDPERICTLPRAGDALQDWTSHCVPFCWCRVLFFFLLLFVKPKFKNKESNNEISSSAEHEALSGKETTFVLCNLNVIWVESHKIRGNKAVFLKFLDKKKYEKVYLTINNVRHLDFSGLWSKW